MNVFNAIWCALVDFVNALSKGIFQKVIDAIAWVIDLLPSLPIENEPLPWGDFGRSVGYFIPVSTMLQHFSMMLAIMIIWYGAEYAMRWVKMIK